MRLDNRADGVPGMTHDAIAPGASFLYEFTPPDAGTFFFHPHVGVQLDRGLYAPLIVEPRTETLDYDREAVLMLDDWLDGIDGTPDAMLRRLRRAGMGGMDGKDMGDSKEPMGMRRGRHTTLSGRRPGPDSLVTMVKGIERDGDDAGDVRHPLYLINGRPPEAPARVTVGRGDRLRLRLINAGSDTIFCVFVEGHQLTVTHADGQRVRRVHTDALVIGMGERYDVLLDAERPGAHRIIAVPLGKPGRAVATLRYRDAPRSRPPWPGAPFRIPAGCSPTRTSSRSRQGRS